MNICSMRFACIHREIAPRALIEFGKVRFVLGVDYVYGISTTDNDIWHQVSERSIARV